MSNDSKKSEKLDAKRLATFKIISLTIGIVVALGFSEIVTRVFYFGAEGLSYKKINSFIPLGVSGFLQKSNNPKTLYELKPHLDSYFKLKRFETNSLGFRDKEYTIKKPENTIRGIVIGDSFTMASGVSIENAYHSVVEESLNSLKDGYNYEMLNFGVGGYNLLNYQGVLESKVRQFNPDFIVIGYCAFNDHFLPAQKHYEGDFKIKVKEKGRKPFFSFYLAGLIDRAISGNNGPTEMFEIKNEELEYVDKMFAGFSNFGKEHNIPIIINVVSVLPDNGNLMHIQDLAKKNDLPLTHSFGKFDQSKLNSYVISRLDHHPNKIGHKIYAETLLAFEEFNMILENARAK